MDTVTIIHCPSGQCEWFIEPSPFLTVQDMEQKAEDHFLDHIHDKI